MPPPVDTRQTWPLFTTPTTNSTDGAPFYIRRSHLSVKAPATNCQYRLPPGAPIRCLIMGNGPKQVDASSGDSKQFTILHFNDCYNVEPSNQEPVGGAARFVTALRTFRHCQPIVLFSGDIIAPSIMSAFTKGEQMLPVMEECGVDCALFGNHEFDFGLEYLVSFAKKTTFPWLMSNVFLKNTDIPLGEGKVTHVLEKNGIRIGLVGLIEEEWLYTLVMDPNDIHYVNFITEGRRLAKQLREQDKVDLVIALTHMRTHNDIKLAESVPEIDLILGGHDHDYDVRLVNGRYIIKSGTDFRQFSKIDVTLPKTADEGVTVKIEEVNVTSAFTEDPFLVTELEKYNSQVEGKMENVIALMEVDLDGKFASIRSRETNLGNLIADIMLDAAGDADFALLNSGTLRSDRVHPAGPFKMRDLVTILPYMESIIVLTITGEQVHGALENAVYMYPKLEGRFAQVAGIKFAFDPSAEPGKRVPFESIQIGDSKLEANRVYKVVTKEYIAQGKDGFDVLKDCPVYKSSEDCMPMIQAVQEYFEANLKLQQGQAIIQQQQPPQGVRRPSLISISRRMSKSTAACSGGGLGNGHVVANGSDEMANANSKLCRLSPQLEGRIVVLSGHNSS